jgi:hypothetical protein
MEDYLKIGIAIIVLILVILLIWYFTKPSAKSSFYNGNQERSDQGPGTSYQYNTVQESQLCQENPEFCDDHIPAPLNDAAQDTQSRGLVPSANQPDHNLNLWKSEASTFAGIPDDTDGDAANEYFASKGKLVNQNVDDVSNMHMASRFSSEGSQK